MQKFRQNLSSLSLIPRIKIRGYKHLTPTGFFYFNLNLFFINSKAVFTKNKKAEIRHLLLVVCLKVIQSLFLPPLSDNLRACHRLIAEWRQFLDFVIIFALSVQKFRQNLSSISLYHGLKSVAINISPLRFFYFNLNLFIINSKGCNH